MASTKYTEIADVIEPSMFTDYIVEQSTALDELIQSGIMASDPKIDEAANSAGRSVEMPFWDDLTGDSSVATDNETEITPDDLSTDYDYATKDYRTKAFKSASLIKYVAGSDPVAVVGDRVAKYIIGERQRILLLKLTGVFGAASMSGLVNDVSIEDGDNAGDDNLIDADIILDTLHLQGDHWNMFKGIAMHSVPFHRLQTLNLIDFQRLSDQSPEIPTYMGRRVFIDDNLTTASGSTSGTKYYSYFFGEGAIGFANCPLKEPLFEIVDLPLQGTGAGQKTAIVRMHMIMHPRGVRFASSGAITTAAYGPSDDQLKLGTNWTRAFLAKNIRLAQLITNG